MTGVSAKPDVECSIWIARPPEDVWRYLYDVSNESQWRLSVKAAQWISDPPHGVGSTGLDVVEGVGDWPWEVTEWQPPRIMGWDVTGGRFEGGHSGYRVEPEGAGSRVTAHMRLKPSLLTRILMLIMKRRMKRELAGDLERLKAIVEA